MPISDTTKDRNATTKTPDAPAQGQANNEPKTQEMKRSMAPNEPQTQDLPEKKEDPNARPQSYVWLADGSVLRAFNDDLPGASGAGNPHGHWQRGNEVFEIVGIYPVQTEVEE